MPRKDVLGSGWAAKFGIPARSALRHEFAQSATAERSDFFRPQTAPSDGKRRAVRDGASMARHDSIEHDIVHDWKLMNELVTVDKMRRSRKKRFDDAELTIDCLRFTRFPRPQDKSAD
jgi:hypothetical protein